MCCGNWNNCLRTAFSVFTELWKVSNGGRVSLTHVEYCGTERSAKPVFAFVNIVYHDIMMHCAFQKNATRIRRLNFSPVGERFN